ncbi:nuclear transport factor 2 family protein [Nisaea sediminum]|uniref:nuclear transport factor 2 family protein n=1 Tax=Nisaea sediminum TaxID=2775867 RepID=UPI0018668773|nr:nuclear transport factor 2 family protein [Nisaea sediminum]
MASAIPIPAANYFAARSPEEVADCFTADGVAFDESQTYNGRTEILRWREGLANIRFRQELLSAREEGERTLVTCRVSGDFKGSPVELDYTFEFAEGLIRRLEIT